MAEQQWVQQQEAERAMREQQAAQQAAQQAPPPRQVKDKNTPAWLEAWQDPMAGADAFSSCICTADLAGDGEFRLVVATAMKKMKVWNGTSLTSEHDLLEPPGRVHLLPRGAQVPQATVPGNRGGDARLFTATYAPTTSSRSRR